MLRRDIPAGVRRRLPGLDVAVRRPRAGVVAAHPCAGLAAAALVYGHFRTASVETEPGLKIALIQGNIDIQLDTPLIFARRPMRSIESSPMRRLPSSRRSI